MALPHNDVIKWKYFPRYWPFVHGIHRSPVNSPNKDHWCGALMLSLICTWTNSWANTGDAGDLRRHCQGWGEYWTYEYEYWEISTQVVLEYNVFSIFMVIVLGKTSTRVVLAPAWRRITSPWFLYRSKVLVKFDSILGVIVTCRASTIIYWILWVWKVNQNGLFTT